MAPAREASPTKALREHPLLVAIDAFARVEARDRLQGQHRHRGLIALPGHVPAPLLDAGIGVQDLLERPDLGPEDRLQIIFRDFVHSRTAAGGAFLFALAVAG